MAPLPRSGLFGFLLLLAALVPSAGLGASPSSAASAAGAASVDARLSRITAALRQRQLVPDADTADNADHTGARAPGPDTKLAWVFGNGPFGGFRNGWGNGGFRNGGWGNGGWPNVGWRNGWGNGGGWRNGGWFNRW